MSKKGKPSHPRKAEITRAAVTCFLERGYHQTGVRDIAGQAGVSLGNLYNHFKGKEAILVFIAELEGEELSGFVDLLSDPDDPMAALVKFMEEYEGFASQPENAVLGVEILTEAMHNTVISEVFEKNRSHLVDALTGCLIRGSKSGAFAAFKDTRTVALAILDSLEGHGLRSLSDSDRLATAAKILRAFLLEGLRSQSARTGDAATDS